MKAKKDIPIGEIRRSILARRPISLGALIRTSVRMYKPRAQEKRQTIAVYLPKDKTPIQADPSFFIEIFENVLCDALEYADEDATISVSLHKERNLYTISVHGEGIPILSGEAPYMFTEFYRSAFGQEPHRGDSVSGLCAAQSAIEVRGGKIWFVSSPKGTTFYFTVASVGS